MNPQVQSAMKERGFAWAKYYKLQKDLQHAHKVEEDVFQHLFEMWEYKKVDESVLWKVAELHQLEQNHYTQYMCGSKTYKDVLKQKQKNEDGTETEVEVLYHFTQDGDPYKPWKEGDEETYYMNAYLLTPKYFRLKRTELLKKPFVGSAGFFALKEDVMAKMPKGKLGKYKGEVLGEI